MEWGIVPAWNATANFFANTIPDFFVNTVWNDWIVDKMWNQFIVGTIWNKVLMPAWNWINRNIDDILLWAGAIIAVIGLVCLFIPGGQTIGAICTVLGAGLSIWQVIRRYS